MRIILIGRGKMGTLIRETAAAAGDEIEAVFGRDDLGQLGRLGRVADVVMDFSRPEALPEVASYVRRTGTPLLSGTTGYTEAEKGSLFALGSAAPVLWSANYSLGVAVLARALQVIAPVLGPDFDIEITETTARRRTPPAAPQSCCWKLSIPSTACGRCMAGRGTAAAGRRMR